MERDRQRQVATNEALVRDVNEAIERGQWPGEEDAPAAFRCECARLDCNRLLELTPREYEQIRLHPRRFVVAPGHEAPEVETVVIAKRAYCVVEKRGYAGELAQQADPRG
ncbi:MAG: hypothetical protein ABSG43_05230 [Solirubrobacteraceae bacterium]|jgi:hypothetical protein